MSAFAELIANFLGLVHEMKPEAMQPISLSKTPHPHPHPVPFLYVSGHLYPAAKGFLESIKARNLDVEIFDHDSGKVFGIALPLQVPTK